GDRRASSPAPGPRTGRRGSQTRGAKGEVAWDSEAAEEVRPDRDGASPPAPTEGGSPRRESRRPHPTAGAWRHGPGIRGGDRDRTDPRSPCRSAPETPG